MYYFSFACSVFSENTHIVINISTLDLITLKNNFQSSSFVLTKGLKELYVERFLKCFPHLLVSLDWSGHLLYFHTLG